jgi:hypothetical protein
MSICRARGVYIGGVVIVALGLLVAMPVIYVMRERQKFDHRLVNLLCQTDYQALLGACRELSERAAVGDLKPMVYSVRRNPSPEAASFPRIILDINPLIVRIEADGRVWLELHPIPKMAVIAYPEDYEYLPPDSRRDVELTPGLWFFDEQYRQDIHPEYVKHIDQLVHSRKGGKG